MAHRVVIIGGGFGGLVTARGLRRAPVEVTLIDRHNYHLFQPLLYQVATGTLSPANIASPLRALLKRQKNARVLLAEAREIDVAGRRVIVDEGELQYDTLVVAAGSSHSYFGHDEWSAFAPGLKSIEDATTIRRRILLAFEEAERCGDSETIRILLNFVVVGAGPTGVELAGQMSEISRHTLKGEFRAIHPEQAQVSLIEYQDRVLPTYPPDLSARALRSLEQLGVNVLTGAEVTQVEEDKITYRRHGETHVLPARTILWAAGVRASPLGQAIAAATGAETDRIGRVIVEPDVTVPGHPEIFIIGDLANYRHQNGKPLPGVAPVAMQQARYVAKLIRKRRSGKSQSAPAPFNYRNRGTLATIGRYKAIADLRFIHLSGLLAWLVWLFVHLMSIVQFSNRVLIFVQWGWSYFTRDRAARLITEQPGRTQELPKVDSRRTG
ncbi:MAG TPA: NAD(P)/FAD-dependent oxidoreductase [Pirellulales bacterium]|jgi:NADH dehydrogenase|nr:NAD(P)/FAD-dependent oxidoreductase [Pirellulales bacterium]